MKTIALRYADIFAPECGTIDAHKDIINKHGFVWYGKLGSRVSPSAAQMILDNDFPKILLVNSGKTDRYWAYVDSIMYETPDEEMIPDYYRDNKDKFKTWFRITRFEKTDSNIMSRCIVSSSKQPLNVVSRASMSPYFKIEYMEK